jgi:hypothetical protein
VSIIPESERQINIWIGERDRALPVSSDEGPRVDRALTIGQTYVLNFRVGPPVVDSRKNAVVSDVPAGGLLTEWVVVSQGAELSVGTLGTKVRAEIVAGEPTWRGEFQLNIPETGESEAHQLKIKPLEGDPFLDVVITARAELYRQFKIKLDAMESPPAVRQPVHVTDELMPTPTAHVGLRSTHEWTTPNGKLNIIVSQPLATVLGNVGAEQISSAAPWPGVPALVSGKIKNVRDAAEEMRSAWETHLNDVDPADLARRLKEWHPEYNWDSLGNYADVAHQQRWEQMAVSPEFRKLGLQGRQLFLSFFPHGSNLNQWISALPPGARLDIFCTPTTSGTGFIPHVPWGLMYVADVPPIGQPIDPMGFLGLRCRIGYTSHDAQAPRTLGTLDASHRAHLLYWGDAPHDVTGKEAQWQRSRWSAWKNQVFVPKSAQTAKTELLTVLENPQPSPTSVLYFFCQCNVGAGSTPTLRFGSTNDPENMVAPTDFPMTPLADRPLVFANACTTAGADPYMANALEEAFFARNCRAYIGTETKVPIVFGSRFAEIFFQFFYRLLDGAPMAAGEAVSQTRLFLWTQYRNVGGLFYAYVNQYDLFLASEEEFCTLRA